MKKNILDEYCSFAFFVAEYIEGFYENNNIQREDRYMGYIIENLLPIYVMHNKNRLKVAYTDMNYYQ